MKPGESDFATMSKAMKDNYAPAPSEIVQRFRFNNRFHRMGESVSTYIAELRALAEFCNFGDTLNLMIRDRLVCGINDENTQRLLLAEKDLTYAKALEIAVSQEAAAQNVPTLRGMRGRGGMSTTPGDPPMELINAVKSGKQPARQSSANDQSPSKDSSGACYRCGNTGHKPAQCKFLSAKCRGCGKIGHLKKVCRSSNTKEIVKTVEETPTSAQQQYDLYQLVDATLPQTSENPYKVTLTIEGQPVQMEIDTGASLSLVSEETQQELWPTAVLQKTSVQLKTYTGTSLKVLGVMNATVCYEQQTVTLPLLVVGVGASLLGRNWLKQIALNWKAIHNVNMDQLQTILNQYSEVFKPGVGMLKEYKAHIFIDPSVPPKFCKARSLPYTMKPLVEAQLDKLVQEGILSPIEHSEWAAPIVPVMKADRQSVRICGDFK